MSKSNHPVEQEELMAYLDGELETRRAVAAAGHLERCGECQELAADLRKLSQEMMVWEVKQSENAEIPDEIVAALEKRNKAPKKHASIRRPWSMLFTPRRLAWTGGGIFVVLFAAFLLVIKSARYQPVALFTDWHRTQELQADSYSTQSQPSLPPPPPPLVPGKTKLQADLITPEQLGSDDEDIDSSDRTVPTVPMIARMAGLTLTTKEFDKTRASLEEILKRHNGYMGELKVSAPSDSGRSLTATLRIPASQFEAAMAELKQLGRVENESQSGEEVTQQYVDLEARLVNGRHTEQRLTEILRQRTGKLQDVLKVELEIDRVRGEIEQMQAEKKELSKRVAFATLNTTINEEYHARLQGAPPSTGSRFRNAAVDGYNTVVEGLIDVGLFLLSAGPTLLLWAAILFFPARWAWRKLEAARKRGKAEEEKA
jgi:Domain of unknown function (DUF4349)